MGERRTRLLLFIAVNLLAVFLVFSRLDPHTAAPYLHYWPDR